MAKTHKKSFLAVLLSLALLIGTVSSTLSFLVAAEGTTGKDLVVVDPSSAKELTTVEQISEDRKVPLSSVANATLTGGMSGAPTTGSALYMTTSDQGKSGILKEVEGVDLDVLAAGGYVLDAWIWVSDVSKLKPLAIRLYSDVPTVDKNGDKIGANFWQWVSGRSINSYTQNPTEDAEKIQNGWNHLQIPLTGVLDSSVNSLSSYYKDAVKYLSIHNHGASEFDMAIASVTLKLNVAKTDEVVVSGNEAASDFAQVNPSDGAATTITSVSAATLTGGAEGAPTTGNAVKMTIPAGKQSGIRKQIALTPGVGRKIIDMWLWVEDASAQGMTLAFRLHSGEPTQHGSGGYVASENVNKALNGDIDALTSGKQTLQNGWNHVVLDISAGHKGTAITEITYKYVTLYSHTTSTKADINIAIGSISLRAAEISSDDVAVITEADNTILTSTNANAYASVSVKNNSELTGGAAGAPTTGTAYYATIDGTAKNGVGIENLNFDASNVVDKNRKAGDLYQFDAWVWIEDAAKIGNFVIRFFSNNLPENGSGGSRVEGPVWQFTSQNGDIDCTQEDKQALQTGWNHIILAIEDLTANTASFNINAITFHDHRNNGAKDGYSFAIASAQLKKVGELEASADNVQYEKVEHALNYNCDEIDAEKYYYDYQYSKGETLSDFLKVDTTDKKEGTGALSFTSRPDSNLIMHITNPFPVKSNDTATTYQIEDMDNAYFGFWFYCDNPSAIQQLALEFSFDATTTDLDEWQWNLQSQVVNKGWNRIVASLKAPSGNNIGQFDKENIRRWRIFCLTKEKGADVTVKVDDISVLKVNLDMEQTEEKALDDNCDAINKDKYTYKPSVTLDTTDAFEGTGCLKFTSANTAQTSVMQYIANKGKMNFAINNLFTDAITFKVYVNDPSLIKQAEVELSSLGQDAADELQVSILDQLTVKGWNEVILPLLPYESQITNKGLDLSYIRHFRIFMLGNGNGEEIVVKLDDIKLDDGSGNTGDGDSDITEPGDNETPKLDEPEKTGVEGISVWVAVFFVMAAAAVVTCFRVKKARRNK